MPSSTNSCVIPILVPSKAGTRTPPKIEDDKEAGLSKCSARRSPMTQSAEDLQGARPRKTSYQLDLDVDTRRKVVEALKRVHRLRGRLMDVDQPLVGADLEVLARVLVLERAANHAVDVLLGRERHRAGHCRARAGSRLDDLARGLLDRRSVVGLEPDPDLVLRESRHVLCGPERGKGGPNFSPPIPSLCRAELYSTIDVTTPDPTVRPPSRMA